MGNTRFPLRSIYVVVAMYSPMRFRLHLELMSNQSYVSIPMRLLRVAWPMHARIGWICGNHGQRLKPFATNNFILYRPICCNVTRRVCSMERRCFANNFKALVRRCSTARTPSGVQLPISCVTWRVAGDFSVIHKFALMETFARSRPSSSVFISVPLS